MSPKRPGKRPFLNPVTHGFKSARGFNRLVEDRANGSILTGRRRSNSYASHITPQSETQLAEQRQANEERRHQEMMALLRRAANRRR